VLSPPGAITSHADLARCIVLGGDQIPSAGKAFFGIGTLQLFMFGTLLFSLGEIFKVRPVQIWPGKGLLHLDWLMCLASPFLWSPEVAQVEAQTDPIADALFRQQEQLYEKEHHHHPPPGASQGGAPLASSAVVWECNPKLLLDVSSVARTVCHAADALMKPEVRKKNIAYGNRWRVLWAAAFQAAGMVLWVPAAQAELYPCLHESQRFALLPGMLSDPVHRIEFIKFGAWVVLLAACALVFFLVVCLPRHLPAMHLARPEHWTVFPESAQEYAETYYQMLPPAKPMLSYFYNGALIVFASGCLLFGELGSPWREEETWIPDFWGLWRLQVFLYVAEFGVRWFACHHMGRAKGLAPASVAEEAAYASQVTDMLCAIIHQVADAAGEIDDVQTLLAEASAKVRSVVLDVNRTSQWAPGSDDESEEDQEQGVELLSAAFSGNMSFSAGQSQPQEFVVDNRYLQATTDGLGYRHSKDLKDHDLARPVAAWFSSIKGYDEQDGWVRVEGGGYLPSFVDEKPVLTAPHE